MPALLSILLDQEEGRLISNAPKKDAPKIINNANKKTLKIQLVDKLLSAFLGSIVATRRSYQCVDQDY
jgi:hypothetical protein